MCHTFLNSSHTACNNPSLPRFFPSFFPVDRATHISRCLLWPPRHTSHTPHSQLQIPFATRNWTVGLTFTHRPLLIHPNEQFSDSFRVQRAKHVIWTSWAVVCIWSAFFLPICCWWTIIVPWLQPNQKYFIYFPQRETCIMQNTFWFSEHIYHVVFYSPSIWLSWFDHDVIFLWHQLWTELGQTVARLFTW